MNINDYCRAMDKIVPDAQLKERIMKQSERQKFYIGTDPKEVYRLANAIIGRMRE